MTSMISLRVLPVFKLRFADVERHAADVAEVFIAGTDGQVGRQIAVGRAVVAAATRLMEHQFPVFCLQTFDQFQRCGCGDDACDHAALLVSGTSGKARGGCPPLPGCPPCGSATARRAQKKPSFCSL
jgi:hypothetical protein